MKHERKCLKCKKNFITYRDGKFCSLDCYRTKRWSSGTCKLCGKKTKFRWCSKECRNKFWCDKYYGDGTVMKSFWTKKFELMKRLGGKCVKCGETDFRVLDINHKDRAKKEIPKKRNYSWSFRLKEWEKNFKNLELLCANCHRRHTWGQMKYGVHRGETLFPLLVAEVAKRCVSGVGKTI